MRGLTARVNKDDDVYPSEWPVSSSVLLFLKEVFFLVQGCIGGQGPANISKARLGERMGVRQR